MKKCYIFGAGASYGYDETLPRESRPPLTKEFFTKGHQLDIFTRKAFPDLYDSLEEYLKTTTSELSDLRCDIEEFLQYLATKFNDRSLIRTDSSRILCLQRALSQSSYFIYELFRHYMLCYTPSRYDNYRRLALHFDNLKYNVITLNYDTLFEEAIRGVNFNVQYFSRSRCPRDVPIAKLHGSINFMNPFGRGIAYGGRGGDDFLEIIGSVYSNSVHTDQMVILSPTEIKDTSYKGLVRSGRDYYEPALIPPLGGYKDYEKVKEYQRIWEFAESMLREASELVIIGCSVRPQDQKLSELLEKTVRPDITVTVVDNNSCAVEEKLKTIFHSAQFKHSFKSFEEYTRTL